jgi:hypothetical protein
VDSKGRVSIPALFRRVLERSDPNYTEGLNPELVIVYGDHRRNYLECYTISAIEEVDAKIDALPRGSMERRMLQRLFHGQSFPTVVDDTGRLVLPAKLRRRLIWMLRRFSSRPEIRSKSGNLKLTKQKNWPKLRLGLIIYQKISTPWLIWTKRGRTRYAARTLPISAAYTCSDCALDRRGGTHFRHLD